MIATQQKDRTVLQAAELQEKRNKLSRRIELWRVDQAQHMPAIAADLEHQPGAHPEKAALLLPSELPPCPELDSLRDKEARLRLAQADDSLAGLRRLLRITAGLAAYKFTQIGFGQGPNTRARAQIDRFKEKVTLTAQRYRAAYQALISLDPQGEWMTRLRHLADSDIRWPSRDLDEAEGTREISWIWRTRHARTQAPGSSTDAGTEGPSLASEGEVGKGEYQSCLSTAYELMRVNSSASRMGQILRSS